MYVLFFQGIYKRKLESKLSRKRLGFIASIPSHILTSVTNMSKDSYRPDNLSSNSFAALEMKKEECRFNVEWNIR
jgi:hypothetical protein